MERDRELIRIVDAAVAQAARKSGSWLLCRPGCFDCCLGPFPITQLDAARLRSGLAELRARDPERAARLQERVRGWNERIRRDYPVNTLQVLLEADEAAENEPCPVLDPETGTCDLYEFRPITCRTFGPPMRFGSESLAVCDLCFRGASDAEIAACEVEIEPGNLEALLVGELEAQTGACGDTVVAFALAPAACNST
ncbi:MAG: zinc/iron-chelating domain-containing protein [Terriglobia bacterium]|nr:MAG: zinc/iron-chelating domain-containing protein [Terriglobia bacterium]